MKRVCALVLVLLFQAGDGARLYQLRVLSAGDRGFSLGGLEPHSTWYRFWYQDNGAFRMQMSEPADARLQAAAADVARVARQRGFRFTDPVLRQTKPELDALMPSQTSYILAMTYHGSNMVIVNRWWMDRLNDQMLRSLMGHELGHVIDRQNQRTGHPSLDILPQNGSADMVADMLSMEIWDYSSHEALERCIREERVRALTCR